MSFSLSIISNKIQKIKCCSLKGLYTSGVYEEAVRWDENTNLLGDFVTCAVHIYQDFGTSSAHTQIEKRLKVSFLRKRTKDF